MARAFWRLSYRCGRNYGRSLDALGSPILIQHEREDQDSYNRRLRTAKPRNHCGPIIRKYNDFVFRTPAKRADPTGLYATILEDADAAGTPLDIFMRRALRMAQIEREAYLLPDSTRDDDDDQEVSQAQAAEAGFRPYLRRIAPDAVAWWRDDDGQLCEAIVIFADDEDKPFARHYDETYVTRIELKDAGGTANQRNVKSYSVAGIGAPKAHNAGACPLVRLRPLFDEDDDSRASGESQIAPMAELQQEIYNLGSLLTEELFNVTFSQAIVTGVSADQVKDAKVGNNRLICIPDPNSKWQMIGADPDQATSIRTSITDAARELYRIAGVQMGDPLEANGQAESGIARAFKFNDLAANLSALADACETAENQAIDRLFAMNGQEPPEHAVYPDTFESPDFGAEMEVMIRALTVAQMPDVIKKYVATQFASRNLKLSKDEQAELQTELDEEPDESDSTNPFPDKPGARTGAA